MMRNSKDFGGQEVYGPIPVIRKIQVHWSYNKRDLFGKKVLEWNGKFNFNERISDNNRNLRRVCRERNIMNP